LGKKILTYAFEPERRGQLTDGKKRFSLMPSSTDGKNMKKNTDGKQIFSLMPSGLSGAVSFYYIFLTYAYQGRKKNMGKKISLMPSSLSGAVSFSWFCCRIQAQNQRPCSYKHMYTIKRDLL
jgi:hypothetical protein